MKNEPWVRFGIFINPKISENPADSRKRRPPSVMLLTASTSQRLMRLGGGLRPPSEASPRNRLRRQSRRSERNTDRASISWWSAAGHSGGSLGAGAASALQRRIVARVDRL